jgi:filamentous hemagglutinin
MYDYWPGYKAGTLAYNQAMGDGSWTMWEVVDAASIGVAGVGKGLNFVAESTANLANRIGMLREASSMIGNFSIGSVSSVNEASILGKAWVGPSSYLSNSGRAWISADGLKIYRPPSFKPNWGNTQANFMRINDAGKVLSNAHLTVGK